MHGRDKKTAYCKAELLPEELRVHTESLRHQYQHGGKKSNIALQRLLLFSLIDDLAASTLCSPSQGCRRCLLTGSWTQGTVRPFAPRIHDAESLTSHRRTSTSASPNMSPDCLWKATTDTSRARALASLPEPSPHICGFGYQLFSREAGREHGCSTALSSCEHFSTRLCNTSFPLPSLTLLLPWG